MAEFNDNLWAPWRSQYIHGLGEKPGPEAGDDCFLCRYAANPDQDEANHVLWRSDCCLTTFNTFPYCNGHLLIAPLAHVPTLDELDDAALSNLFRTVRDAQRLLAATTSAHGYNVGMNFGRCAGAGLPGHLHVHIVPRWDGDTNFMSVFADTRVISESMDALRERMRQVTDQLGLPPIR